MKTIDHRLKVIWVLVSPEGRHGDPVEGRSGKVYGTLTRNDATGQVEFRMSHEAFAEEACDLFAWRRRHDHLYPTVEIEVDETALPPAAPAMIMCGEEELTLEEVLKRINDLDIENQEMRAKLESFSDDNKSDVGGDGKTAETGGDKVKEGDPPPPGAGKPPVPPKPTEKPKKKH